MDIYTDGGCSGNPGKGAWAFVILREGGNLEGSGFDPATTNNKMELTAVIKALEEAYDRAAPTEGIAVHTDSQYVKNGITTWIKTWKRNGWRTSGKDPVKNRELWERLDELNERGGGRVQWRWVKGHAGQEHNERCDQLVRKEMGI